MRTPMTILAALLVPAMLGAQGNPASDAVRAYRTAHERAVVGELRDLVAIPNLAVDSANIERNAAFLVGMLERRGLHPRLLRVPGSPPAVYGELRVPNATRTVVLYAHYDGQPPGPAAAWTTPPWEPVIRDRALSAGGAIIRDTAAPLPAEARLYGRSASDDKGGTMALLLALDALRGAGLAPDVNVKLFLDGEEEAGSPHLREMLKTHAALLGADLWLLADGPVHLSGRRQVVLGVRGTMGLELTVYGPTRALHSGHYGNWAPNPAAMLATLLASLRDDEGRILVPHFMDDVVPVSAAERRALAALPAPDDSIRRTLSLGRTEGAPATLAERIMAPAINLRGLRSGNVGAQAANAVPVDAQASIDFRLVPGQTPARVRALVEAHLASRGWWVTHDSVTPAVRGAHARVARLQWESGYPATRASVTAPEVRAVVGALAALPDGAPLVVPTLGGSLPAFDIGDVLRVPLVILPMANPDNNQHAPDENLRLGNLWQGAETYATLLARLGRSWPAR